MIFILDGITYSVSTVCKPGYVTDVVVLEDKPAEVAMEVSDD